jgi:HTH-type transcriptional regulator/antitoxin HigA
MTLKLLKNEEDYNQALAKVDSLMNINPQIGTQDSDTLEVLVMLIEKYEDKYWAISEPDPIEAIKIRMEQMHLKQKDLVPYIGNASKVSEVLNKKIGLSLSMITNLASALKLPLEMLISLPKKQGREYV